MYLVETGKELVATLQEIFLPPPGFRPAHGKGILLKGTFTPTPDAGRFSIAKHFNEASTAVIARFSDCAESTHVHPRTSAVFVLTTHLAAGTSHVSDASSGAQPNGFAIRFQLEEHPRRKHTDIVAHSVDGFPGSNGDEALGFFSAVKNNTVEAYLITHPKALAFVQLPKPSPESFATQRFFSVQAFKLIDAEGTVTFIRYRIVPVAGFKTLSEDELETKGENYLFEAFPKLLEAEPVVFKLTAQVAEEGDVTDDGLAHWPEQRSLVELGTMFLDSLVKDDAAEQKKIIFDPVPRDVPGGEPSADPLLEVRAAAYLVSGRERRAA